MFKQIILLSELEHDTKGEIIKIRGEGDFHRQLMKAGLCCGCIVEMSRVTEPQNCVQVYTNGQAISLTTEEASRICLEVI